MSNYGWTNEEGEPIMDGAAYRFEQALDAQYAEERFMDDDEFFGDEPDYGECFEPDCGGEIDPTDSRCFDCGELAVEPGDLYRVGMGPGDPVRCDND